MISTPPENIRRLSIFELGLSFLNGDTEFYFRVLRHHQPNKYNCSVLSHFSPWDESSPILAVIQMIIYNTDGLKKRIGNHRADEADAPFLHVLAHGN